MLLNIGRSVARHVDDDNIKYFAQELKQKTYNSTRMNLVMRGINPDNICVRKGDALEDDWPFFEAKSVSATATAFVKERTWPGNVRQLYTLWFRPRC